MPPSTPARGLDQTLLTPLFGPRFLEDHAGHIMGDPKIALVELIANASDAGAHNVQLDFPSDIGGVIRIVDDGTGMTRDEFEKRWRSLSYNRVDNQGKWVVFPEETKTKRKAFGRNGKGRHGLFCFNEEYSVDTWRDGVLNSFLVRRGNTGQTPFTITHTGSSAHVGHGTRLSTVAKQGLLPLQDVKDVICSRFIADPEFTIFVNGEKLHLTDLGHLVKDAQTLQVPGVGAIQVVCIDSKEPGRTMYHAGVAWWVHGRLVGVPSWDGLDGSYVDGRTSEAKRYTFIVEADMLEEDVRADWTAFKDTQRYRQTAGVVRDEVVRILRAIMQDVIRARKRAALEQNNEILQNLTPLGQDTVGQFLDRVQQSCPTLTQRDLTHVTTVLAQLEEARSGYDLLRQLAILPPNDLDALHDILAKWTVRDAQLVLDELNRRLLLIKDLERLVENPAARELADLQPLFERGLWIFGPEYESVHFTSNRTLSSAIGELFGVSAKADIAQRPDFVAVPELVGSIGAFSSDAFDDRGESNGLEKVLILELKRGAFKLTRREVYQAQTYAADIRNKGHIGEATRITAIVLGSALETGLSTVKEGNNEILPRTYATVIQQAHNRTFRLLEKIRSHAGVMDSDVRAVVAQKTLDVRPIQPSDRSASPTPLTTIPPRGPGKTG